MRFVITGAAGHVSKPLTEMLLHKGHAVTVVGRSANNLQGLVANGATVAIGDMNDGLFLAEAFKGADGVYLMLPPMWDSQDQKSQSVRYARTFASAIDTSGVDHAIFLSSFGAHRLDDAGPISGMGRAEVVLSELDDVNVLSLRAGYFYTNLLLQIELVRATGEMGNMFTVPAGTFTVVDPEDIARVASEAFDQLHFSGHTHTYVISDLTGTDEIASLFGVNIGRPELRWLKFPASEIKKSLIEYGFAEGAAADYIDLFTALDRGLLFEDIQNTKPTVTGTSIEDFAKTWGATYNDPKSR